MTTGLPVFDATVQETNLWLKDIQERLGSTRHQAYAALRATLHVLRDRLRPESAMQFSAQLPLLLRGVFTEGWKLSDATSRPRAASAFVYDLADRLSPNFPIDAETVARVCLQTIRDHIGAGEADKVMDQLPRSIRELWFDAVA